MTQGSRDWTVALTMSDILLPQTVAKDNFTLYNNGNVVEIDSTVYEPHTKRVFLELSDKALSSPDCTVSMENVLYLSGTAALTPEAIEVKGTYDCDLFDMSVESIKLFQGKEQVVDPVSGTKLSIVVRVLNESNTEKSGTLRIFLSDSPESNIFRRTVTLPKGAIAEYRFDLPDGLSADQTGTICAEIE